MKRLLYVLPTSRDDYYLDMIRGIHACVSKYSGWTLDSGRKYYFEKESATHFSNEADTTNTTDLIDKAPFQNFDAVISYAHFPHDLDLLSQAQCPVILLCPDILDHRFISISPDPEFSAKLMVSHLHDCGYESLTMMNQDYSASDYRKRLYESTRELWLNLDRKFHEISISNYDDLLKSWPHTLTDKHAFIYTAYERMEAAIRKAQALELAIPEEIGFLSTNVMNQLIDQNITITHVNYNTYQLGYDAAKQAINWAETKKRPAQPDLYQTQTLHLGLTTYLSPKHDQHIHKAIAYIEKHYRDEILMEDILAQLTISQKTLERKFKDQTGQTPNAYLINHRLKKLMELLSNTTYPMSVLAAHCGFQDPRYMSRVFKKRHGITPREYRAKSSMKH